MNNNFVRYTIFPSFVPADTLGKYSIIVMLTHVVSCKAPLFQHYQHGRKSPWAPCFPFFSRTVASDDCSVALSWENVRTSVYVIRTSPSTTLPAVFELLKSLGDATLHVFQCSIHPIGQIWWRPLLVSFSSPLPSASERKTEEGFLSWGRGMGRWRCIGVTQILPKTKSA
jgi:hypothetical protein